MKVTDFKEGYAAEVAALHIDGIKTGFITSLGADFVTCLYRAIAENNKSFGYVAEDRGQVVGFIMITANLKKLYKSMLFRRGICFAFLLAGKMFSLKKIKNVLETLSYPSRVGGGDLPDAEVLSVVVAERYRRKGLAAALMQRAFEECERKGIERIKVMVGSANEAANSLYRRCGYELVSEIDNHGVSNNLYLGLARPALLKPVMKMAGTDEPAEPLKIAIEQLHNDKSKAEARKLEKLVS